MPYHGCPGWWVLASLALYLRGVALPDLAPGGQAGDGGRHQHLHPVLRLHGGLHTPLHRARVQPCTARLSACSFGLYFALLPIFCGHEPERGDM